MAQLTGHAGIWQASMSAAMGLKVSQGGVQAAVEHALYFECPTLRLS